MYRIYVPWSIRDRKHIMHLASYIYAAFSKKTLCSIIEVCILLGSRDTGSWLNMRSTLISPISYIFGCIRMKTSIIFYSFSCLSVLQLIFLLPYPHTHFNVILHVDSRYQCFCEAKACLGGFEKLPNCQGTQKIWGLCVYNGWKRLCSWDMETSWSRSQFDQLE